MAAASTLSAAPRYSPPASDDAPVEHEDPCLSLRLDQNQRHHRRPSLSQLLPVNNIDVCSSDASTAACGGEDPVVIPLPGLTSHVIEQEYSAIAEQPGYARDLVNSTHPTGAKSSGGGGEGSTSSDGSEECSTSSGGSSGGCKPHQGNDGRWKAIRAIISREGDLRLSHFLLQKKLGCGDIGTVYLAELSGTSCSFAMKIMNKDALESRKKLLRAQTEREILERLDHPFLPTLYTHFETEQHSCLVMEYCPGGDLHSLRQRRPGKCFSEQAARFYVAEVLLALEYLHMLGIVYRDLKPENVLVRADGHIMLSDFDLSLCCTFSPTLIKTSNWDASHLKSSTAYCIQTSCIKPSCMQPTCFSPRFFKTARSNKDAKGSKPRRTDSSSRRSIPELSAEPTSARSMSFVGTHEYLAPEIIKGEGHGSAVDWWTLGIFLYELLFGKTPFKGPENRTTLFNVVGEPLRFPEVPQISFAAKDLIKGLLVKDPQQRLAYKRGATEIKQHPFFQSVNWALIRCASPPEMPKVYGSGSRRQLAADAKSAVKQDDIDEFF